MYDQARHYRVTTGQVSRVYGKSDKTTRKDLPKLGLRFIVDATGRALIHEGDFAEFKAGHKQSA